MEEQNEQDGDITNENSKAETFEDAFDFNIDDLGIKILGEVFLCNRCQKQISQRDADVQFFNLLRVNIFIRKVLKRPVLPVQKQC